RKLSLLAEGGAFEDLGSSRREALWDLRVATREPELPLTLGPVVEDSPRFRALSTWETIAWDYRATSHSPRGHPLGPMREVLAQQGLPSAQELNARPHGRRARYAGLVICRQRP